MDSGSAGSQMTPAANKTTMKQGEDKDKPNELSIGELIKPARPAMMQSIVMSTVGAILAVVPYIAITELAVHWLRGDLEHPWRWVIIAIIGAFVGHMLYSMAVGLTHIAEAKLRYLLRVDLVRTLGRIPLGRVDQTSSGKIRKMVVDDTSAIHTIVAHLAGDFSYAAVSLIFGFAYLLWVDWRLSLVLLAVWIVAIAIAAGAAFSKAKESMAQFAEKQMDLSAATVEMVEGIEEIKNFQAADVARTRFDRARKEFADVSYKWMNTFGRGMSLVYALLHPGAIVATVAPLAFLFVYQGWMEVGYTLPFFLIGIGIPSGLMQLVSLMQHLYEAQLAAHDTAEMLSTEPMPEGKHREDDGLRRGEVAFENVSFGYNPGEPVLKDISFVARAGEVTAVVGPSGGGKTTIARLIARFYDPDSGVVCVAGVDAKDVSLKWLLSQVAIVFQDISLAHDTVAANISLGHENVSREQIEEAAKAACIHERIMRLPNGYDTVIGEEGGFFSGGERQRITIARAYLQDAPILVLDEATAQADPRSEREIHRALSTLSKGRTVIIIAHRLATIANADQIIVVADGQVAESGKHAELLAHKGMYAGLWEAQQLAPVDAAGAVADGVAAGLDTEED